MNISHAQQQWHRFSVAAGLVGWASISALLLGWLTDAEQAYRSYLWAYMLWWEVSVGCLGVALIRPLTGGNWSDALGPYLEAGIRTLPLIALLFGPIAMGLQAIYPWADSSWVQEHFEALGPHRRWYLEPSFVLIRAAGYFILLGLWSAVLMAAKNRRLAGFSGVGLLLWVMIVTHAGFDWVMSLEPFYHSSMFGAIIVAGAGLCGMSVVVASAALSPTPPTVLGKQPRQVLNDLGNLELAFVMFWMYLFFSQFLITWMGDVPEEAVWYLERQHGGWSIAIAVLCILQFVLPFCLLLSKALKRTPRMLASVTILVVVSHAGMLYWLIAPTWYPAFTLHWTDLAAPLGIGGVWLAFYAQNVKRRLPHYLPQEAEASDGKEPQHG